ncbi:hypothetical protein PHSY_005673 [Pseudozyma hubeiensis SY62]|uniref:Uncharacterized protein n=1 Tax=Pseudozyma hubeiensis (strain SY62) TaxID=1305764 RepID=R9P9Q6_PSEHS|nr:hypothetical protein PHSY_005673 [Pseudozyma hubeiensis SY62]GAC98084.1 hypothetical protein PHSY_005673 [Pseudozyma hubeiensis SY62]
MRAAVLLVFCLICLASTAQAAPASAQNALQDQMLKRRNSKDEKPGTEGEHHRRRRHQNYPREKTRHPEDVAERLHTRELPAEEARNAERAVSGLLPQEELVTDLKAKVSGIEQGRRDKARQRQQEIQVVDSIHMARYGKAPPKFPAITRVGSAIGLTAAVMNVVNFIFSAKTTALATDQFSAPPTPPTLIDTAARWDGSQYTLLPVPEDEPDKGRFQKQKRSKLKGQVQHFRKRLVRGTTPSARLADKIAGEAQHDRLSKRWIVSSIVGAGLGAALAPGFTSTIRNKEEDVDKPPFDPYDPNVLKPKDSFSAAAALPNQPLPAAPPTFPLASAAASTPPNVDGIVFPVDVPTAPATSQLRAQVPVDFSSGQTHAVLRKRAVHDVHSESGSSSTLDKRFFFSGGPWSKFAGAVTVGSIIPLLAEGVSHARWRQTNPRDRDILKELDNTPTYGAVGVPGHQPGQLATNAMPGYGTYVTQLEQQQAAKQAATQTATQSMQGGASRPSTGAAAAGPAGVTDSSASGLDNDSVLRRRGTAHLEKRNKWLAGGGLALFGALLGYAQSATQFPTDRDEEKDKKKKEAEKKQQELMAKQQQMQGGGDGGQLAADPSAGAGGASQADLLASIPVKPLPGVDGATMGGYPPAFSDGVGSGFASPSSSGAFTPAGSTGAQSQGSTASLSDSLNAAAGYQTSGSGAGGSGSVLRKRDVTSAKPHLHDDGPAPSLSKRNPGIGTALSIGGTAMFLGTLAGNIYVGDKEKKKPVPLVTPNANTRGPMIPGGDLYTEYLESQRGVSGGGAGTAGQDAIGGVGSGVATGAPASVKWAAAAAPANFAGGSELASSANNGGVWRGGSADGSLSGSNWGQTSDGSSEDAPAAPVLKKRTMLKKRTPLLFPEAAIAETEGVAAAEAGAGALSRLGQGAATASETEAGTASLVRNGAGEGGATRAAYVGRGTAVNGEASLRQGSGLVRGTWMGMGSRTGSTARIFRSNPQAWGSARPAMVSEGAGAAVEAGTPATVEGATATGGEAAAAGKEEEAKGWSVAKAMGVIGGGAGATMTFNGIG